MKLEQKSSEILTLHEALYYLKVKELGMLCEKLNIPAIGTKIALIQSIIIFLQTGNIQVTPSFPAISKAQKGLSYLLAPNTLILKGFYKNDLATRIFFKSLIGNHFHYTAFGIDWIKERWYKGIPYV